MTVLTMINWITSNGWRKKDKLLLFFIIVIGFLIRLVYAKVAQTSIFPDESRFYGDILYFSEHFSFQKNFQDMPFMAVFFGLLHRFFYISLFGMKFTNICFSVGTVFYITKTAGHLSYSRTSPILAASIAVFYPYFVFYSELLLSESIFLGFLTAGFYYYLRKQLYVAFLLFGLAQLTRPTVVYFVPIAIFYYYFVLESSSNRFKKVRQSVLAACIFALCFLPWVARNYSVFGEFMISKPAGHQLWEGNNPWNKDGGVAHESWGYLDNMPKNLTYLERDNWEKDQAINFIVHNPIQFVKLAVKKFIRFWNIWPNAPGYNSGIYKWVAIFSFGPVLIFSLIGVYTLRHQWKKLLILWLFIAYYTAIHMITIGSIRYRLPLEPLLIGMAAASLAEVVKFFRKIYNWDS
jgi:4-amino-4-deoxy-L-arabinose transferase-like glycosyltransferase